ncbi:hypothetical protein [Paenibacillus anseongense]|uniref:hypothetical protein n=1 Tax=Paenibacillus anseongense TaxID=2682845 RepID=UPI002DB591AA|nr:hypothetical protein [Paenibacillus anseongense]MEC0265126.1 hypothetical protein [Paenibacillus anseongense]
MELTTEERIMRLETRLETELVTIKELIYDLKKIVMMREETYVTKDILESKLEIRDREIASLKADKQSNKNNLPVWLGLLPAIAAVFVAIVALWK